MPLGTFKMAKFPLLSVVVVAMTVLLGGWVRLSVIVGTVVPLQLFRLIEPPTLYDKAVMVYEAVAVSETPSSTCTVKLAVPAAKGVPVMTPAEETLRLIAVRLGPPEVTDHVLEPLPPVAASVVE